MEVRGAGPASGEVGGDARVMVGRIAVVELAFGVEMQQRESVLAADVGRVGVEEPLDVACAAHLDAV